MAQFSEYDAMQVLRASFSDTVGNLKTSDGFLVAAVGRKIVVAYPSATTETYTFKQDTTTLYVLTVTYVDATKADLSSVERTA
jgi:hypothetical protein